MQQKSIILYHGGDVCLPVEDIDLNRRDDYDFGMGFYMTPDRDIAEEWVRERDTPVINTYKLSYRENEIAFLSHSDWLKVIIGFRKGIYRVVLTKNIIVGEIANDRMFPMLNAFMRKAPAGISDKVLFDCITSINLGVQYVLKRNTSCLEFVESRELRDLERQEANNRHYQRRRNMENDLEAIQRKRYDNEKFMSDYIKECGHGFTI